MGRAGESVAAVHSVPLSDIQDCRRIQRPCEVSDYEPVGSSVSTVVGRERQAAATTRARPTLH